MKSGASQGRPRPEIDIPPFSTFLDQFKATLGDAFHGSGDVDQLSLTRGLPPDTMSRIMASAPLSVCIPAAYGGRGGVVHESMAMLETSSYESLALGLTFGINWALFLQPVSRYAVDEVKGPIFDRFLHRENLGGLMITEPDHGTDALNMQTAFARSGSHYHLLGTKHWGGLTGQADYWLIAARERSPEGNLKRDINFFICDVNDSRQEIVVEEYFENLGVYQIPYGRNRIDVQVPENQRLEPTSTGIRLMLDTLHRSRMQIPGIGQGFLRRMFDEALAHCRKRLVGGRSLFTYDQVQSRLARLEASVTICSAMCLQSSENAEVSADLSANGLEANSMKTVVTDMMQDAAQSLLQLVGAKGYRLDHIAGRATVDSRPFQIFEGSNDVLYAQISEVLIKLMERVKETNLYGFLKSFHLTSRSAEYFREHLSFTIDGDLPQRKLVDLGRALGRIVSMEWVLKLGDRGFRPELISNGLAVLRSEISGLLKKFTFRHSAVVADPDTEIPSWRSFLATSGAGAR